MKEIIKDLKDIEKFLTKKAAKIVGTEAVNHFTENFDKQGFNGKKWKDVKRRDPSSAWYGFSLGDNTKIPSNHPKRKGAKGKYKRRKANSKTNYSKTAQDTEILSSKNKSSLENSLEYKVKGTNVIIKSDKDYAKLHNEGGRVKVFGRKTAKIPKRQFVGPSKELEKILTKKLTLKNIIK